MTQPLVLFGFLGIVILAITVSIVCIKMIKYCLYCKDPLSKIDGIPLDENGNSEIPLNSKWYCPKCKLFYGDLKENTLTLCKKPNNESLLE
jgi:hypothetical protein